MYQLLHVRVYGTFDAFETVGPFETRKDALAFLDGISGGHWGWAKIDENGPYEKGCKHYTPEEFRSEREDENGIMRGK